MPLLLHNGIKLERFKSGDRKRTANSASVMGELLDVLDALCNPQIVKGKTNSVTLANNGLIFQIQDATELFVGAMVYRLEYANDADPPYLFGDVVRVSPSSVFSSTQPGGTTVPGIYVCIKNNPNPDSDFPIHPLQIGGETLFWHCLGTWPSEIKVCNGDTGLTETWLIDGQKKPEVTADSTTIKTDSDTITADS